LVVSYLTDMI